MEIFRDPIWQFIGIVISAIIAFYIYSRQKAYKQISYEVATNSPLLAYSAEVKGRLVISFDSKVIDNLRLLEIIIRNSGNLPVVASDYEQEISFVFNESVEIFDVSIIEMAPGNLRLTASIDGNAIKLSKVLLNSGDYARVKVLLNNFDGRFLVDGRIAGVKSIQYYSPHKIARRTVLMAAPLAVISITAAFFFGLRASPKRVLMAIRVTQQESRPIANAKVVLVYEQFYFVSYTESNGLAVLSLPESSAEATVDVEAAGYERYRRIVAVIDDSLIEVRLVPSQP